MSLMADREYFEGHTNSKELEEHFKKYCEWCWYHGFGNCDVCEKIYHELYIPLRKRELQIKCGLIDAESEKENG